MTTVIRMPKNITTLAQYKDWVKSVNNGKQELEVWMKRRTSYYPYAFTVERVKENNDKVHYLISDTISWGFAYVKSFNRIFTFKIRTY